MTDRRPPESMPERGQRLVSTAMIPPPASERPPPPPPPGGVPVKPGETYSMSAVVPVPPAGRGQHVTTRRFELHRDRDVSGVSGVGVVADGVLWPDGSVSIRWRGDRPSVVFWQSLEDAEQVHGHGGATRFVWLDGDAAGVVDVAQRDLVDLACIGAARARYLSRWPESDPCRVERYAGEMSMDPAYRAEMAAALRAVGLDVAVTERPEVTT